MKATVDIDDALYRRLKVEAARRGRTVRELIAEGVRQVLAAPAAEGADHGPTATAEWRPSWLGSLGAKSARASDHSMAAVRSSVARGRKASKKK